MDVDGVELGKKFIEFIETTYDDEEDRIVVALRAYLLPADESAIFMELVRSDQERLKIICDKMVEMGLPDVEEIK